MNILLQLAIPITFFAFIFLYKWWKNDRLAMTGKFSENRFYKISSEVLLETAGKALKQAKFKKIRIDNSAGILNAKAGFSVFSWGEEINVALEKRSDGVLLKFLSVCALPVQVVDWQKNKTNAEIFFRELDLQLSPAFTH